MSPRRYPSFSGLQPASGSDTASKRANTKTGTSIEVQVGSLIWKAGLRYRKNSKKVLGQPDFVFGPSKVAVFCDGDFWHGKNWEIQREKLLLGWNANYWISKIERNMERDKRVTEQLEIEGWMVMRFWESDIKKRPDEVAGQIVTMVRSRRAGIRMVSI